MLGKNRYGNRYNPVCAIRAKKNGRVLIYVLLSNNCYDGEDGFLVIERPGLHDLAGFCSKRSLTQWGYGLIVPEL
jgi:hypothetical protein